MCSDADPGLLLSSGVHVGVEIWGDVLVFRGSNSISTLLWEQPCDDTLGASSLGVIIINMTIFLSRKYFLATFLRPLSRGDTLFCTLSHKPNYYPVRRTNARSHSTFKSLIRYYGVVRWRETIVITHDNNPRSAIGGHSGLFHQHAQREQEIYPSGGE